MSTAEKLAEALEALLEYATQTTEYDGQVLHLCPSCGKQDGEHSTSCDFAVAKRLLSSYRAKHAHRARPASPDDMKVYDSIAANYRAHPAADARPTIPASAPGAAEHLAVMMRAIATKCRVGYVISKTINSNIRTAAEISAALSAGFAAAQPAADGAQRVERMSEADVVSAASSAGFSIITLQETEALMRVARAVETHLAASWGVKLNGEGG